MRFRQWLALLMAVFAGSAYLKADSILIVGAGTLDAWHTEIELANPSPTTLHVQLSPVFTEFQTLCPGPCQWVDVSIPGFGSASLTAADVPGKPDAVLATIYVNPEDGATLPTVRARVVDTANPHRAIELAAVRLSTLTGHGASPLTFPSAVRVSGAHSNLVVGAVVQEGGTPTFAVRVDAYSQSGQLLASKEFSNDVGLPFKPNLFLVDVLAQLNISTLEDGVVRVTKTAGDGDLWGELFTVYADHVASSVGWNP